MGSFTKEVLMFFITTGSADAPFSDEKPSRGKKQQQQQQNLVPKHSCNSKD